MAESTAHDIALFVFIPFCKIKCTYCDFNAYANLARVMEPYSVATACEIQEVATRLAVKASAKSVYFGGGTPSLVPVAHVEKILRACTESFSLNPNAEITLEGNPGTVDLDKLRAFRSLGINRLSLGVQSFDDATVRRLNRGHTVQDALEAYDLARRAGFDNLNLDFIYGLPLQTLAQWHDTLEQGLALVPEHLSLYGLKVEEGTGLEYQIAHGKYPHPDDNLAADMYILAEEMLAASGYIHYEISNWARPGLEARHNLTYWHNEPYLGFGAGAHSSLAGKRYWNMRSPVEYIELVERGANVVEGSEEIGRELEMAETMILGLRLGEGVLFERFEKRFGEDAHAKYGAVMREVHALGLVELDNFSVRLTPRGRLLSNEVFWRFLPD